MAGLVRMPARWMAPAFSMLIGAQVWAGAASQIPVEDFFRKPAIGEVTISPSGRHLAIAATNKEGVDQLVILDTGTLATSVAAAWKYQDVVDVDWISDKRLIYSLSDQCGANCKYDYSFYAGVRAALYAVDRDGKDSRQVSWGTQARLTWRRDSDDVILVSSAPGARSEPRHLNLTRIDTRTGTRTPIELRRKVQAVMLGPDDMPHVVWASEDGGWTRWTIDYRASADSAWTRLDTYDPTKFEGGFGAIAFASPDSLYVVAEPGPGYSALYTYDLKTHALSPEPVLSAKGFDLSPWMLRSGDKVVGWRYETDAKSTLWLDADLKRAQERVDALLPGTINLMHVPLHPEVPKVLVASYSDVEPGRYFVFDTKTEKLVEIGRTKPEIDPKLMAHRDFVRYAARDGMQIPAWITVPNDGAKGPRPMVVLVHDGPFVRGGHWEWRARAQFLASRGYVVLEPEYRGSDGYGAAHFKAGWKQWGRAMQDDIADGARWAIAKGIADPKRICIGGVGYGGYATLVGLVKDADLYRCGFESAGITDLELIYSLHWSGYSDPYKTLELPVLVGDPEKDAEQIKAVSPIEMAPRLKQPLLMAWDEDARVPLKHATDFLDVVRKTNSNVEWMVQERERHDGTQLKYQTDFWTRVEKFLARNIGDGAK